MTTRTQNQPARRRASRGFSIIETLVAISILLLAITGPMAFAQSSLRAAAYARDQVTAFFLAQDAIEFVKHIRDENSLTGFRSAWLDGLADCRGQDCMVSSVDVEIGSATDGSQYAQACGSAGACLLWLDPDTGLYGVQTGSRDPSRFTRRVRIEPVDGMSDVDEVRVVVTIDWQTHPLLPARTIEVHEDIMNWIQ